VVVRGGSVRGGYRAALQACDGGKAVAEGAVLEARPAEGQEDTTSSAAAVGPGSTILLQRCELSTPASAPQRQLAAGLSHYSLQVEDRAKATAADCACAGLVLVVGLGSSLLHLGLAFAPGLAHTVVTPDGGVARELPAAGGAAGPRAEAQPPAAPA
jgi:hypothetical protein